MNITEFAPRPGLFELSRRTSALRSSWRGTLGGLLVVLLLTCGPQLALASLLTPEEVAQLQEFGFQDLLQENLDPNYDLSAITKQQLNEDLRLVALILSGVVDGLKENIDPNYDIRNVSPEQLRADLLQLTLILAGLGDPLDTLFDPGTDLTEFSFEEFEQQIENLDDVIPGEGGGGDGGGGTVVTPLPAAFWLFASALGGLVWNRRRVQLRRTSAPR